MFISLSLLINIYLALTLAAFVFGLIAVARVSSSKANGLALLFIVTILWPLYIVVIPFIYFMGCLFGDGVRFILRW